MTVVRALTADDAQAIRFHDTAPLASLAGQYGVSIAAIRAARGGAVGVKFAGRFTPLCMTADELAEWSGGREWQSNDKPGGSLTPLTPCHDCMPDYALEMRAEGRCNGHPRGVEPDEDEPEIRPPVARKERHMATVNVALSVPCATCAHEPICNRLSGIARLNEAFAVEHGSLPRGLSVALSASIDCDAYMHLRKSPAKVAMPTTDGQDGAEEGGGDTKAAPAGPSGIWTPERRARMAESMRQRNAAAGGNVAVARRLTGTVTNEPIVQLEAAESGS